MKVKWQDIVAKMKRKVNEKTSREIIRNFYTAFLSSIDADADFQIRHIGKFKATKRAKQTKTKDKYNLVEKRYYNKMTVRRHRAWVYELFDTYWPE